MAKYLCILLLTTLPLTAHAARHALLIANSVYDPEVSIDQAPNLPNPSQDVDALAGKLRDMGFAVQTYYDLNLTDMGAAVNEFAAQLRPGDVALFYYAGHALELDGQNWLQPVRTVLDFPSQVNSRALNVQDVLLEMERQTLGANRTAKGLNLLLLDACRDNPFRGRGFAKRGGTGLAGMKPNVAGTLISFAAAAGKTAADGIGTNSPYALSLLDALDKYAGNSVEQMFKQVVVGVLNRTEQKQQPWLEYSFTADESGGDFCLHPKGCAKHAWQRAQDLHSAAAYRDFIADYPYSDSISAARRLLASLVEAVKQETFYAEEEPQEPAFYSKLDDAVMLVKDENGGFIPKRKLALLIGNSNYSLPFEGSSSENLFNNLTTPSRDVRVIQDSLAISGFDVITKLNLSYHELIITLSEFSSRLESYDFGLFYFSGNGFQFEDIPYIVPIGTQDFSEKNNISIKRVYMIMNKSNLAYKMIILDSCRYNYDKNQRVSFFTEHRHYDKKEDWIFLFAAEDGGISFDTINDNVNPFASSLAKNLGVRGANLKEIINNTIIDTKKLTDNQQKPEFYLNANTDIYLSR